MLRSLHDNLRHWDFMTTQTLIADRFRLPIMYINLNKYAKTCDACQCMKNLEPYETSMFVLQSSLFDVFLVDVAGSLTATKGENRFQLVCAEHFTEWPIVKATKKSLKKSS